MEVRGSILKKENAMSKCYFLIVDWIKGWICCKVRVVESDQRQLGNPRRGPCAMSPWHKHMLCSLRCGLGADSQKQYTDPLLCSVLTVLTYTVSANTPKVTIQIHHLHSVNISPLLFILACTPPHCILSHLPDAHSLSWHRLSSNGLKSNRRPSPNGSPDPPLHSYSATFC